ncbi:hypothetical protein V8B97DRAFT_2003134 [Scleroderma yunnanense]
MHNIPLTLLTPEFKAALQGDTPHRLRRIVSTNISTNYTSSSPLLSDFQRATADKNLDKDVTIVDDFHRLVPLTNYKSYRPFIANSTSSNEPKCFPISLHLEDTTCHRCGPLVGYGRKHLGQLTLFVIHSGKSDQEGCSNPYLCLKTVYGSTSDDVV